MGDLIALFGMTVDTWIDPKTRTAEIPTFQSLAHGGEPRVMGGRGIAYQRHLAGDFEVEGWNTVEVVVRSAIQQYIFLTVKLSTKVERCGLTEPEKPGAARPITQGRIALEIEAAEIYFRNVELRNLK